MPTQEIKPGDQVIYPSLHARKYGPFTVRRISGGLVWVKERRIPLRPVDVVRLQRGQTVKQALRAVVRSHMFCQICGERPAPERHFITVPIPQAFTRVCMEDMADIKKTIRKRVEKIVAEVFEEAKKKGGVPCIEQ